MMWQIYGLLVLDEEGWLGQGGKGETGENSRETKGD